MTYTRLIYQTYAGCTCTATHRWQRGPTAAAGQPPLTRGPQLDLWAANAHDSADDLEQAQPHQAQQQGVALRGLQVLGQPAQLLPGAQWWWWGEGQGAGVVVSEESCRVPGWEWEQP